ncbi:MAG: HEAT repeat domain-containing protein [Proteobacteria bacterium]|nr:HEAT repeat domain-containing protein [Pseudomonadota bacterium]
MADASKGEGSLQKDVRRKLSGVHKDVAQLLFNLAKTARSFGFYDRENQAIKMFLEELEKGFEEILTEHGVIRLLVGADRFVYDSQEVYHDGDRENGMPFRLYRDGVRALVFKPGLTQDELEELLDILAKRASTGRNAEEEDLVTLLWKKSFEHVTYSAVEGFTHDLHAAGSFGEDGRPKVDTGEAIPRMMERISGQRELVGANAGFGKVGGGRVMRSFRDSEAEQLLKEELGKEEARLDAEGSSRRERRRGPKHKSRVGGDTMAMAVEEAWDDGADTAAFQALGSGFSEGLYPGARDYPLILRGGLVEIQYTPLEFEEIAAIRTQLQEEGQLGLLHLLDYCFELCMQEPEFFGPDDFTGMLQPIRRYLVRARDLKTYDRLLRYLRRIGAGGVYPEHLTQIANDMLQECSSGDALGALVAAASGDEEAENLAWDILQQLLPNLEPSEILRLLGHGMTEHMANILAGTLIRRTGTSLELYDEALKGDERPSALAALRCLATLRTPESIEMAERAITWPDPVVRRAIIRIAGRVETTERTPRLIRSGLEDLDIDVRDEALKAVDRQGDPKLAQVLFRWFAEHGFKLSDDITRNRIVQLVAEIDPVYATRVLSERLKVKARAKLGGLLGTPEVIEWNRLAVEGLAVAATPDAIERLRAVRTAGSPEFRELVTRRLVDARRRAQTS